MTNSEFALLLVFVAALVPANIIYLAIKNYKEDCAAAIRARSMPRGEK